MNRSTKSLMSGLASLAAVASLAPTAFAGDPGSLNAIVGAEESPASEPSSVNAIVGGDQAQPASSGQVAFSSPNSIVGADALGSPSAGVATASAADGFDWGDAAIGTAVGRFSTAAPGVVGGRERRMHGHGATVGLTHRLSGTLDAPLMRRARTLTEPSRGAGTTPERC